MPLFRSLKHVFLLPLIVLFPVAGRAATVWNEGVNGSLSSSGATPTPITLSVGTNSVIGNVTGGTAPQDWVAITVPAGDCLTAVVLAAYSSTDAQGFTGFQAGSSFVGSTNTAANYLGYSHFGTGATNGSQPATNLVGVNLLPLMADTVNVSIGSQGFSPPLGAGTYTFLFQQLGASTNYQFDFGVTAVPEPASLSLLAAGGIILLSRRRAKSAG